MANHECSISSMWKRLLFVCGGKGDTPCTATLQPEIHGGYVLYKCPVCGQTTYYYDVEKFVNKITQIIIDDSEDGCDTNLTNYQMKMISRYDSKQHIFKVLSHTPTQMKVSLTNG